jgi:hypothetical protein
MPSRESSAIAPGRSRSPRRRRLLFFSYAPALCWRPRRRRKSPTHSPARTETLPTVAPSFFDNGALRLDQLASYSGDFDQVFFHYSIYSNIQLLNPACGAECFNPNFGEGDIFLSTGTYHGSDPSFPPDNSATLVISGAPDPTPIPEPHAWLMAAIGFAFFAFARSLGHRGRRVRPGVGVARAPQTC